MVPGVAVSCEWQQMWLILQLPWIYQPVPNDPTQEPWSIKFYIKTLYVLLSNQKLETLSLQTEIYLFSGYHPIGCFKVKAHEWLQRDPAVLSTAMFLKNVNSVLNTTNADQLGHLWSPTHQPLKNMHPASTN